MKFYHATDYSNLGSILVNGLKPGCDGVIYLCKRPEDCLKFAYVHGVKNVLMVELDLPSKDVVETFDHSYEFFKCRAYGYPHTVEKIDPDKLSKYQL